MAKHTINIEKKKANLTDITFSGGFDDILRNLADPVRRIAMERSEIPLTSDHALWAAIRNRTDAIGFNHYSDFIDRLLCVDCDESLDEGAPVCTEEPCEDGSRTAQSALDVGSPPIRKRRASLLAMPSIYGVDAYNLLKMATQAFLLFEAGVAINPPRDADTGITPTPAPSPSEAVPEEESRTGEAFDYPTLREKLEAYLNQTLTGGTDTNRGLLYLRRIADALLDTDLPAQGLPYCVDAMRHRFSCPSLLELIWSYWHEEGMLVQTMNAICMRFQNRRGPADRDPLATLEIDPLRPLNNILWGYVQDEYNRLTVQRRAYEYDHHYGLKIVGKAVPELRSADSRSKFIEAFHNLLNRAAAFYRADADTTVIADGFPMLNSLREVHLLLAEGAHNQFGDLPWTSRAEMLTMQWILARPEMREFLRGRAMVPYQESWMGQVDTMKKLQGWTDTTITHFRNLAAFGEQVLLSVRYGDWVAINNQDNAKIWARYWRPEIQGYIHAYLSATGVDLSAEPTDARRSAVRNVQPSVLLQQRLATQGSGGALPSDSMAGALTAGTPDFAALPGRRRRALNPAGDGKPA
jgi:hypothetical protein